MNKNIKSFDKYVSEMARPRDPNKPRKPGIFDKDYEYPQYNPDELGYGNPDEWRRAFNVKMGYEEAVEIMGEKDPYVILGISQDATIAEIKKAYRKKDFETHPDTTGRNSDEEFKEVGAAYEILKHNLKF